MTILETTSSFFKNLFYALFNILWGDFITIPLPGGSSLGLSLLVLILIPSGIYFTLRTKFLPLRLFPEMIKITAEKRNVSQKDAISGLQALIVSTATRVGMGNLVGVVAAISAGGAGALFWMWLIALLGSSTAFIEGTLAQLYKERDPLYGGYRGGPAYYIHHLFLKKNSARKRSLIAVLFAISGLICWCGISQVIGNSVSSAFSNAFRIDPHYTTIILVAVSAFIVLRKNATVKVLDVLVPFMAVCYFLMTIFIIIKNAALLPSVFAQIFSEAFGLRQAVAGGIGAVIMNGAKRGLFSNEAGSGSAPCAAAAADINHPAKEGLLQALGVFIDTIVICSCSARDWKAWTYYRPPCTIIWGISASSLSPQSSGFSASRPLSASCSTPAPMWPIFLETTGCPRLCIRFLPWSCFISAAWQPMPSCGTSEISA